MNEMKIGNTQRGVSLGVMETLQRRLGEKAHTSSALSMVDVPCGEGEFAQYAVSKVPSLKIVGVDFFANAAGKVQQFFKLRAQEYFRSQKPSDLDVVTCISGVMCFDGIEELFHQFYESLKSGGLVIVTNDNFMTLRDRFNFFFFGRFKRFKLCYDVNEGNWNSISPQGIWMLLERQKFKKIEVKYTSVYPEDYLFLPLALVVYPVFFAYLLLHKSRMPKDQRLVLFPFKSLLARHYIVSAIK